MNPKCYEWTSKEGITTKLSLSANFDNIISRHRGIESIGSIILRDCGIVYQMPRIMRYCLEQDMDLRHNTYLCDLNRGIEENREKLRRFEQELTVPLKADVGTVRSESGNLVIYSDPEKFEGKDRVSFEAKDVPRFIEGIVRVLDCEGVRRAGDQCEDIVMDYITYHYMLHKESQFRTRPNQ